MFLGELIAVLFVWSFLGMIMITCCFGVSIGATAGAFANSNGLEFLNPRHIYKYNQVNWFGAIVVAILYNLICPIASIGYWFYKLCTIGRKV